MKTEIFTGQKSLIFKTLRRRWVSSLDAVTLCHTLKLSTRLGEMELDLLTHDYRLLKRRVAGTTYLEYRIERAA